MIAICYDLHNTLIKSNKAWLKAFKKMCREKYSIIKQEYKFMSRKSICKKYDINSEQLENEYRKYIKLSKKVCKSYYEYLHKLPTIIISNAPASRVYKDIEKCKLKHNSVKIYTKEDGEKPDSEYINKILLQNKIEFAIMIGDNKNEDVFDLKNVRTILVDETKNISQEINKILEEFKNENLFT